jgi:hypothetical protein
MNISHLNAPPPDLRIVPVEIVHAHETHDMQRSGPLIERMRAAEFIINPPIVAPMGDGEYVILDGANRCFALSQLAIPHILVQVASYESGYVQLDTWQHVVSGWEIDQFLTHLEQYKKLTIVNEQISDAIAHLVLRVGQIQALCAPVRTTHERNAILRDIVSIYQQNAKLYRTAIAEPDEIWKLFPDAIALAVFPSYSAADIIAAAKYDAYLPPGISRHIIYGRALLVNYPMSELKDETVPLAKKNDSLQAWIRDKLSKRQVRYYAESVYHFDE